MQNIMRSNWKKRAISILIVLLMSICTIAGGFAIGAVDEVHAADVNDVTVFVTLEGYNIGQGWYVGPTLVTIPKGSNAGDATRAVLEQKGIEYDWSAGYLSKAKVDTTRITTKPSYNAGLNYDSTKTHDDDWLGDFDYTSAGGWFFTVNHAFTPEGADAYVLDDGDVIRAQFSVNGWGNDIGVAGDWNIPEYTHEDKTVLIQNLFAAGNEQADIDAALDVIIDPLATTTDISGANTALGNVYNSATDGGKNKYDKAYDAARVKVVKSAPVYGNEFAVVLQARDAAITTAAKDGYIADLVDKVVPKLKDNNGRIDSNKSTNNSRVILALTALGINAKSFAGYDLTAALADLNWVKKQGINGAVYALIALDSANYAVPKLPAGSSATQTSRANLLTTITGAKLSGGGWALSGTTADPDITGMALQALAPYYGKKNTSVDLAVNTARAALSSLQHKTNGGFGSPLVGSTITAESTAQVLMALDALDTSIYHPYFVKEGATTFDALYRFAIRDASGKVTSFKHLESGVSNPMATELGMLALVSHSLALKGQKLFDMTGIALAPYKADIKNVTVKSIPNKKYNGKTLKPTLSVKFNGKTLKVGTDYSVTYQNSKKIGKATVTITGKGNYTGTKVVSFKIIPKTTSVSKLTAKKKSLKVNWKAVSSAQKISKYQIRYKVKSTSKWKTINVSAKSKSVTLKGLKKGKAYQVQVRSYKTVSKAKYYSEWSKVKTSKKVK
jgi:hypothetical protein